MSFYLITDFLMVARTTLKSRFEDLKNVWCFICCTEKLVLVVPTYIFVPQLSNHSTVPSEGKHWRTDSRHDWPSGSVTSYLWSKNRRSLIYSEMTYRENDRWKSWNIVLVQDLFPWFLSKNYLIFYRSRRILRLRLYIHWKLSSNPDGRDKRTR